MQGDEDDLPFPVVYLLVLVAQVPLWGAGGLLWAAFVVLAEGADPVRTTELPTATRAEYEAAVRRACERLRFGERRRAADGVAIGPRYNLWRLRLQECRVTFGDGPAVLSAPAIAFGSVRRVIERELASPSL